jgi:hypothetical protein
MDVFDATTAFARVEQRFVGRALPTAYPASIGLVSIGVLQAGALVVVNGLVFWPSRLVVHLVKKPRGRGCSDVGRHGGWDDLGRRSSDCVDTVIKRY